MIDIKRWCSDFKKMEGENSGIPRMNKMWKTPEIRKIQGFSQSLNARRHGL